KTEITSSLVFGRITLCRSVSRWAQAGQAGRARSPHGGKPDSRVAFSGAGPCPAQSGFPLDSGNRLAAAGWGGSPSPRENPRPAPGSAGAAGAFAVGDGAVPR